VPAERAPQIIREGSFAGSGLEYDGCAVPRTITSFALLRIVRCACLIGCRSGAC
jgi:hypothetical protein